MSDEDRTAVRGLVLALADAGLPVVACVVAERLGYRWGSRELRSWRRGDQGPRRKTLARVIRWRNAPVRNFEGTPGR